MSGIGIGIKAIERGWVPDLLVRRGIRYLCQRRLEASRRDLQTGQSAQFLQTMRQGPIAHVPEIANQQHYEVPPKFFELVLGSHLKYSSCHFGNAGNDLTRAEESALGITCQRAGIEDGQRILELGCGWGSLSLWMAQNFPGSRITAVSNSNSQREYIECQCNQRGIENLQVVTSDINNFAPANEAIPSDSLFDRVVSIEMFEHMRNYEQLLSKISSWLTAEGKLFVHIFCHREYCYPFESAGASNWLGKHFFTGGIMPSANVFDNFDRNMVVDRHYQWNGTHYQRTLESWLLNMDRNRQQVMQIFEEVYGRQQATIWFNRWRVFFMACAELFGFNGGDEWFVSHYLLTQAKVIARNSASQEGAHEHAV